MSREKNEGRIIKKKRRWECGRRGGEKSRIIGRRREKVRKKNTEIKKKCGEKKSKNKKRGRQ